MKKNRPGKYSKALALKSEVLETLEVTNLEDTIILSYIKDGKKLFYEIYNGKLNVTALNQLLTLPNESV